MYKREFSFIATSEGLTNGVSDNGSRFQINLLNEPIRIPVTAHNINICVDNASLWWISPNIYESGDKQNNLLYVIAPDINNINQAVQLAIPQGLYDIDTLSNAINVQLENAGFKFSPDAVLSLEADNATQKTIIRFNYANMQIDFTQPNTLRTILGFDSVILQNLLNVPQNFISPNTALFSVIDSFYINTDFITSGLRVNTRYTSAIAKVNINVAVGFQILYTPINPTQIPCPDLRGINKSSYSVWITDQNFNPVYLTGYPSTIQFKISYDINN
jgi:hypothetical protein